MRTIITASQLTMSEVSCSVQLLKKLLFFHVYSQIILLPLLLAGFDVNNVHRRTEADPNKASKTLVQKIKV